MRRRLRVATISAVVAAVIILGIPLAISSAQLVRDDTVADLTNRTETAAALLDGRIERGEPVTGVVLNNYVGGPDAQDGFITVRFPDNAPAPYPRGEYLMAGEKPERSFSHETHTPSGLVVRIEVSWWDVFFRALEAVGLVVVAGLVAIIVGVALATWQANRLSRPLVYLSVFAEQMGAGQVNPRLAKSGVDEIDQVADELVRSAERMAARLQAERQFSSDASHQLRTPLTALSMRLEEIASTTEQDDVRVEADAALDQVERLVGVVDDLLGRTRKALGGSTEMVVLNKVLRQQREEWQRAYADKGREIEFAETDATVFASPGGLAQVLATLIENSLIHGGGTTTVAVRESGTTAIVIEVADEGDGVPEELESEIFKRDVTSGKGTGLGLALARDLVTADGGRLELRQSRPAVFSVFLQGVPRMVDLEAVVPHTRKIKTRKKRRGDR